MPNPWLIIGLILAALALGFGAREVGYSAGAADVKAAYTTKELADEKAARAKELDWQAKVDAIEENHRKEMADARALESRLRADIDAGKRRLRIAGVCPRISNDSVAASGSDDTAIELSPAARSAYYDLRAGIISDSKALEACQAYVRGLTGK